MNPHIAAHFKWMEDWGRHLGRAIFFGRYLAISSEHSEDFATPKPSNFHQGKLFEMTKDMPNVFRESASTPTSKQGEPHPPHCPESHS